jgi:hypothetical protein
LRVFSGDDRTECHVYRPSQGLFLMRFAIYLQVKLVNLFLRNVNSIGGLDAARLVRHVVTDVGGANFLLFTVTFFLATTEVKYSQGSST